MAGNHEDHSSGVRDALDQMLPSASGVGDPVAEGVDHRVIVVGDDNNVARIR